MFQNQNELNLAKKNGIYNLTHSNISTFDDLFNMQRFLTETTIPEFGSIGIRKIDPFFMVEFATNYYFEDEEFQDIEEGYWTNVSINDEIEEIFIYPKVLLLVSDNQTFSDSLFYFNSRKPVNSSVESIFLSAKERPRYSNENSVQIMSGNYNLSLEVDLESRLPIFSDYSKQNEIFFDQYDAYRFSPLLFHDYYYLINPVVIIPQWKFFSLLNEIDYIPIFNFYLEYHIFYDFDHKTVPFQFKDSRPINNNIEFAFLNELSKISSELQETAQLRQNSYFLGKNNSILNSFYELNVYGYLLWALIVFLLFSTLIREVKRINTENTWNNFTNLLLKTGIKHERVKIYKILYLMIMSIISVIILIPLKFLFNVFIQFSSDFWYIELNTEIFGYILLEITILHIVIIFLVVKILIFYIYVYRNNFDLRF